MNVELLLEPPLLVDHVVGEDTVRYLLLVLAAVPLAQRQEGGAGDGSGLHDCRAISHYPILNENGKLKP